MFCFGISSLVYSAQHLGDLISMQGHGLQIISDSQVSFLSQNPQFFYWLLVYSTITWWEFLKALS